MNILNEILLGAVQKENLLILLEFKHITKDGNKFNIQLNPADD